MQSLLEISLKSIKKNWEILNKYSLNKASAVVKANAYGLGMKKISKALNEKGCNFFYVAQLEEAISLRKIFKSKNISIAVLEGLIHDLFYYKKYKILPVINSLDQLNTVRKKSYSNIKKNIKIILNFDTGMNRLGLDKSETKSILENVNVYQNLNISFLMSHLTSANNHKNKINNEQLIQLQKISNFFNNSKLTLSNTNGILLGKNFILDQTRPGIGIYGVDADGKNIFVNNKNLTFPIKLKCPILQIRHVNKGKKVSYNGLTRLDRDSRLATIGIGYADGILRSLKNQININIKGIDCKILGAITMDSMIVDITDLNNYPIKVGDYITLINENNFFLNFIKNSNINIYELFTLFSDRIIKYYK